MWQHLKQNQAQERASSQDVPAPECYTDVQLTYDKLCHRMLDTMRQVNCAKTPFATPSTDASDWSQVVKQLARQAKGRSKIFFRRVKHTLLTPPAPSTLPVPNRKIQRIPQHNSPRSASAADLIPRHPELDDVPFPIVAELRELARAARKKSPGPDGVPAYLGSWQDPDRWRPVAMSNCIYCLLMRWCYKKLYPLLSPLLHSRQFWGRQGISTSHATQTFLNDIDTDTP